MYLLGNGHIYQYETFFDNAAPACFISCMQALHRLLLRHKYAAFCLCIFLTDPVQGDKEVCKLPNVCMASGCMYALYRQD